MKKLFIFAIAATLFFPSCTKEELKEAVSDTLANTSIVLGFQIAGTWVEFAINQGGGYYYDQPAYANYNYGITNTTTTIGYITAYPLDETRIAIRDRNGVILGNANLPSGTGSQMNVAINWIRNWFANGGGRLPVLVDWYKKWTNAPWEGILTGY